MHVSYLGEGWLDFAVFIPPAKENRVKSEPSTNVIIGSGFVSDSQQDALSSLQQFAARGVDEDSVFFQRGTCGRGQTTGSGAATIASNTIAVPAEEGKG